MHQTSTVCKHACGSPDCGFFPVKSFSWVKQYICLTVEVREHPKIVPSDLLYRWISPLGAFFSPQLGDKSKWPSSCLKILCSVAHDARSHRVGKRPQGCISALWGEIKWGIRRSMAVPQLSFGRTSHVCSAWLWLHVPARIRYLAGIILFPSSENLTLFFNQKKKKNIFFPLGIVFYVMLLPMPDDNIPPCHCGIKWRRKYRGKRKNCFDLEAFVNDSPFGFRLECFSSFPALYVSGYRETTSGSPSAWNAIIWQDNIADMQLAFMIKEMVEKKLSYNLNVYISQLFQRQIGCNQLWGWIFKFCCHSALFLSVTWDFLSLEKSKEF